jgi:hypothetical protein
MALIVKRTKLVGLCLAAALAFSALGAVAATSAHAAEYGECLKTQKVGKLYKGRFLDKHCTEEATVEEEAGGKKNKYEFNPGLAASKRFTSKSGVVHLETAAGEVICTLRAPQKVNWTLPLP